MTDKVLTDDEKDALLEGVAAGAVEVQSADGPQNASVLPFEIGPRCRIVSDSFPRLQLLNQQFANQLQDYSESLLQSKVAITTTSTSLRSYNDFCEQNTGPSITIVFNAIPLSGNGLLVLDPRMVGNLVESFFGGSGNEPSALGSENASSGELSVSNLFTKIVLRTIREVWESVFKIEPEAVKIEPNMDMLDIAGDSGLVIVSEFDVSFTEAQGMFRILLPLDMIEPIVPIFEGQKGERDEAQDARWEKEIRACLADAVINVTSDVGRARMSLGDLINLAPGDVIPITSPTAATIFAHLIPIMHGRFGVHAGRNAIEATGWITTNTAN